MDEPIQQGPGQPLGAQHLGPFVEGQVAGDPGGAAFVTETEDLNPDSEVERRCSLRRPF